MADHGTMNYLLHGMEPNALDMRPAFPIVSRDSVIVLPPIAYAKKREQDGIRVDGEDHRNMRHTRRIIPLSE